MRNNPEIRAGSIFEATLEEGGRVVDRYHLGVRRVFPLQGIAHLVEVDSTTGQPIPRRIPESALLRDVQRGVWGVLKLTPIHTHTPNSLETLRDIRDKWFENS